MTYQAHAVATSTLCAVNELYYFGHNCSNGGTMVDGGLHSADLISESSVSCSLPGVCYINWIPSRDRRNQLFEVWFRFTSVGMEDSQLFGAASFSIGQALTCTPLPGIVTMAAGISYYDTGAVAVASLGFHSQMVFATTVTAALILALLP